MKNPRSKALSNGNDVPIKDFIPGSESQCGIFEDENGILQVSKFEYDAVSKNNHLAELKYEYDDDGRLEKSSQSRLNILKIVFFVYN